MDDNSSKPQKDHLDLEAMAKELDRSKIKSLSDYASFLKKMKHKAKHKMHLDAIAREAGYTGLVLSAFEEEVVSNGFVTENQVPFTINDDLSFTVYCKAVAPSGKVVILRKELSGVTLEAIDVNQFRLFTMVLSNELDIAKEQVGRHLGSLI